MGLLNRLFNRKPSHDAFAKMLIKRLRASGYAGPLEYNPKEFQLKKADDYVFNLGNLYQQYCRVPKSDHENILRSALTTWHTLGLKAPTDFEDAKPDLMPALRARSYLEVTIPRSSDTFRSTLEMPHLVIAEHLVATLVYDLPHAMMSVNDELLESWDVSFYEAMEVAKDNLHQSTREYAKLGNVYAVAAGDGYDATRLLLTDFVRNLDVDGDPIAMLPNRDCLFLCGSNDAAGLEAMAKLTSENVKHERYISGMAFRLVDDEWEVWMPPEDHPSYRMFHDLSLQSIAYDYAAQKELLDLRHELEGTDIFVASFSEVVDPTGRQLSYSTWAEGADTLLPKTDLVYLFHSKRPEGQQVIGPVPWHLVEQHAGELMEPQDIYPERWRVREFPSEEVLIEFSKAGPY